MGRLVMKFGGTSVANIERIQNVARHVKREVDAGHDVAVVVSAMSGKTNELVAWATETSPMHDAREYDAVVASGEQVTSGLLAIALQALGIQARSWQGWQIPILTSDAHASARILGIDGTELIKRFKERKEVAVIAGFQGIHQQTGRITTLGRGGSDTSAVAIAAAIQADALARHCDFFSIGTNDLTQYALAIDRQNTELAPEADSLHPAVLRLIHMTCEGAARHKRFVGVCGGIAGDPFGACLLAGLGVHELSMSPRDLAGVKARLRGADLGALRALARRACEQEDAASVRALDTQRGVA